MWNSNSGCGFQVQVKFGCGWSQGINSCAKCGIGSDSSPIRVFGLISHLDLSQVGVEFKSGVWLQVQVKFGYRMEPEHKFLYGVWSRIWVRVQFGFLG